MGQINTRVLEALMQKLREEGTYDVQRIRTNADHETMLKEIEMVGKYRNPSFVLDEYNTETYTALAKWLVGEPFSCINPVTRERVEGNLNKGIYLAGPTGTGKSWAMDILRYLASAHYFKFVSNRQEKYLEWHSLRSDEITQSVMRDGDVYRYNANELVLCIQDLGSEPQETMYMGNRMDPIRTIIESRADMTGRILLVTSNYPINHKFITERYGSRVASRLVEMCNYLELGGKDRRR